MKKSKAINAAFYSFIKVLGTHFKEIYKSPQGKCLSTPKRHKISIQQILIIPVSWA